MLLYAFGTLLFTLAMAGALIVITTNFLYYRRAMMVALRSLRLDGLPAPVRAASAAPGQARPVTPVPAWMMQPQRSAAGHAHS